MRSMPRPRWSQERGRYSPRIACSTGFRASSGSGPHPRCDFPGLELLLDRRLEEFPPLRLRAVVVLDVRVAEEVFQDDPGVGRPLADPAVRDDLPIGRDAVAPVQLPEIVRG